MRILRISSVFGIFLPIILVATAQSATTFPGITQGSFNVGQTGAATYTIPIEAPPGINGSLRVWSMALDARAFARLDITPI